MSIFANLADLVITLARGFIVLIAVVGAMAMVGAMLNDHRPVDGDADTEWEGSDEP